ncbi:hypothetical protein [Marinicauda pacifica]|uniref:hypothetical protein n=1 Tax=Marinicauda pacifica TaxID=1133559 RepID=UPI0035C7AE8A
MGSCLVRRLAGACLLAMFAGFSPGAFADPPRLEDAALSAPGPWLRVTYTMTPGASGHTVWMEEGALADPAAAPSRPVKVVVRELTLNHGAKRVAGQAYTIERNTYDCRQNHMLPGPLTVYDGAGRALVTVSRDDEAPIAPIPHSITHEIWHGVCRNGAALVSHPAAPTIADAIAHDDPAPFPETATAQAIDVDIDRDERMDRASIHMRPHSHRHDLEIVFGREPGRALTIVTAAQPDTGPLVERTIRAVESGLYVYDCAIGPEGEPVEPCVPGVAHAGRGGIEVVTPGHPSILVFDPQYGQGPVRLPMVRLGGM